ncbi:putative permease [Escherichia coli]|uniref:Putative permease n=1 Tax=Escherichia coli TaxID=562 RepID=A0A376TYN5_ECOLX|nr:putative permease [Escherichia coli]
MALSLSGIAAHAGADNPFAIPLSAVVGIPLYIRG